LPEQAIVERPRWPAVALVGVFSGGSLAALVAVRPEAALAPALMVATVMICRRRDPLGGLLYLGMLTIGAWMVYGICSAAAFIFPAFLESLKYLLPSLLFASEWRRFLDNEYGQGQAGRRGTFLFAAGLLAAAQVALILIA